jgi:4-amino-4-deoxychorismate lyase
MIQLADHVYAEHPLAADEGFQFGRGIYETILMYRKPLFWSEHIRRLNLGLARLAIDRFIDDATLLDQVNLLGLIDCVLKVIVTADNLVLITRPIPEPGPDPVMRLTLQPDPRSNDLRLLQNKTIAYLPNLLAWEDARARGFDDALFFNQENMLRECSRSTIYLIRAEKIWTPDEACGLLPGTVRQWLIQTGLATASRLKQADILTAESVFVSNAVIGLRRVADIDGHSFEDHPILRQAMRRYQEEIVDPARCQ